MNRSLLLVVLALSVSPLVAATATATRDAAPLPHATMRELALAPRTLRAREERHEQGRPLLPKVAASSAGAAAVTTPTIAAPPLAANFRASWEDGGIPSDASGAVSASYLLSTSNSTVLVQNRSGGTLTSLTLAQFWFDPSVNEGFVYDSRVAYDAAADRWVIVTLYDIQLLKSTILVAVSDSGDPTRGWRRFRYVVDSNDRLDADLPRLALTRDAIVITANIYDDGFTGSVGANVYTVSKSDAYGGGATLPVAVFRTADYDLVPADSDDTTILLLLESYGDASVYRFDRAAQSRTLLATIHSPTFDVSESAFSTIGEQLGSSEMLDCGLIYIHNAVYRNGTVWAAGQLYASSPARSSVVWWRARLGSAIGDGGVIDDPTGKTNYAFPSIAVNRYGAALLGYSVFNKASYISAGYSYVDPSSRLSSPAILKAGEGPYGHDRWADFSTTVVDAANDADFWSIQTVAAPPPTGTLIRWVTWWGKIAAPAAATPSKPRTARH